MGLGTNGPDGIVVNWHTVAITFGQACTIRPPYATYTPYALLSSGHNNPLWQSLPNTKLIGFELRYMPLLSTGENETTNHTLNVLASSLSPEPIFQGFALTGEGEYLFSRADGKDLSVDQLKQVETFLRCRGQEFAEAKTVEKKVKVVQKTTPMAFRKYCERNRPGVELFPAWVCVACGATERQIGKALMVCIRCKWARYCSGRCQHGDWSAHKRGCRAP